MGDPQPTTHRDWSRPTGIPEPGIVQRTWQDDLVRCEMELNKLRFVTEPTFVQFWEYIRILVQEQVRGIIGSSKSDSWKCGATEALYGIINEPFDRVQRLRKMESELRQKLMRVEIDRRSSVIP